MMERIEVMHAEGLDDSDIARLLGLEVESVHEIVMELFYDIA